MFDAAAFIFENLESFIKLQASQACRFMDWVYN